MSTIILKPDAFVWRSDRLLPSRQQGVKVFGIPIGKQEFLKRNTRQQQVLFPRIPSVNNTQAPSSFFSCVAPRGRISDCRLCEGDGDVVGVVTPLGGVAQAFYGDHVVELRVQLAVQEVEGKEEDREGQVEVEEEKRLKEVRPWMTMKMK